MLEGYEIVPELDSPVITQERLRRARVVERRSIMFLAPGVV